MHNYEEIVEQLYFFKKNIFIKSFFLVLNKCIQNSLKISKNTKMFHIKYLLAKMN